MPQLDHAGLAAACSRARDRARQLGRPVLAGVTVETTGAAVVGARDGRFFTWHSPWSGLSITGAGSAVDLTGTGEGRFSDVGGRWRELADEAVWVGGQTGPLAVGGFAFRPARDRSVRDGGPPDALLWVPRVLSVVPDRGTSTLLLTTLVTAVDDPPLVARRLAALAGEAVVRSPAGATAPGKAVPPWRGVLREILIPGEDDWTRLAERAVAAIAEGAFDKVVLARSTTVEADSGFDVPAALEFLRRHDSETTAFGVRMASGWFVGATPELLVRAKGDVVETVALAGSVRRDADPAVDAALAHGLMESAKERHEHRLVVDALTRVLRDHCSDVRVASVPEVAAFARIQHLRTPIRGTRSSADPGDLLDLLDHLHPSPALGGHPRTAALDWLAAHENLERGWYAAPLGWMDARGEGEFAVAIRSALISGSRATLYAGCGIVVGSVPEAEFRETSLKMAVMRAALGLSP